MEKKLVKNGLDRMGNQKYTEVKVYKKIPKGWKEIKGATTAPAGYKWIDNGERLFGGNYKSAFVKIENKRRDK